MSVNTEGAPCLFLIISVYLELSHVTVWKILHSLSTTLKAEIRMSLCPVHHHEEQVDSSYLVRWAETANRSTATIYSIQS